MNSVSPKTATLPRRNVNLTRNRRSKMSPRRQRLLWATWCSIFMIAVLVQAHATWSVPEIQPAAFAAQEGPIFRTINDGQIVIAPDAPPPPVMEASSTTPLVYSVDSVMHPIKEVAPVANINFAIKAAPSVSIAVIRAQLVQYRSPLLAASWPDGKDAAEYIWDAGRVLGIDPAVLMAIFHHESEYGTSGMAQLTDSVGNIRPLSNQPELDNYRFYRTWQEGVDDAYRLLGEYAKQGADTIPKALWIWAPPADGNDTQGYINEVLNTMAKYYSQSVH